MSFTPLELDAYAIVDAILKRLSEKQALSLFSADNSNERGLAKNILLTEGLIAQRIPGSDTSQIDITERGLEVLKMGGYGAYKLALKSEEVRRDKRNDLDEEKIKVDLALAKKTLREFPATKWFARIGFGIAVILAILELLKDFGLIKLNK